MINNQAKPGYKHTALGWIPEEWKILKLKEIVSTSRLGGNYENAEANTGIPVIKMGNLDRGVIKLDKVQYLPVNEDYKKDDVLNLGDLLFNTRNTLELVGKVAIWRNELPLALYNSNVLRIYFRKELISSTFFMNYAFNTQYCLLQLRGVATGTTSVAAIYGRDLDDIKFLLPPLPEQKAIAKVLSTWDKAIEKTQELIKLKEQRKKYLMQQLLTGKKRLKGFKGEWKEMALENCFKFIKSYSITRDGLTKNYISSATYCIHYGDIHAYYETDFLDFSAQQNIPQLLAPQAMNPIDYLKEGDVIMADASEDYEGVGESVVVLNLGDKIAVGGLHTIVLRGKNKMTNKFFNGYLFASEVVRNELRRKATGTSVYSVSRSALLTLHLLLPSYEEQSAIANVLEKCDKDITSQGQILEELKEQKKGLMQVLLTGKRRVKMDKSNEN